MMRDNESQQARIAELEARIARLESGNLALAASRDDLRAILDSEPDCVKVLAADGTLLEMNPAGLRMLEAESIDQLRDRSVYPVIAAEHRAAFRALNEQVMRGGTGTLEFEIVGLKGGRRWLETQATPLRDATGAIRATLGITRDVTARRAERNALAERLSELEQAYRTAPVGLALLDRDLRYLRINERLAAINGRPASEHIGRSVTAIIPELDDLMKTIYGKVFGSGQPVRDLEVDLYALDQTTLNGSWLTSYFPVLGQDGQVVAASSVVFEITERKQAELRLREQQRMLSESQRIGRIGSWRLDAGGRRTWSDETFRLFGLAPAPAAPDTDAFLDLIHPDDRERMRRWVASASTGAAASDPEYRVILGDGSVRHLLGRGEPRFDGEGRFMGIAGTVQDITERKLAQAALERSRELLEMFVEHTPAAIAMFDRDMNYILASRRYRADYGVGDQRLAGRSHYEVFPGLPERWKQTHRRCLEGATEKSEDDSFQAPDGQVFQVRWEIHPWREPDGEIGGIILFAETISNSRGRRRASSNRWRGNARWRGG